jgi:hypothetical protein
LGKIALEAQSPNRPADQGARHVFLGLALHILRIRGFPCANPHRIAPSEAFSG